MVNKFYYVRGGAERYMFEWSKVLEKHGHCIIPFSMHHTRNVPSDYSKYFVKNVDFASNGGLVRKARAAFRTVYSLEAKRNIETLIRDTHPDIAHLHSIHYQLTPSILYSLGHAGVPVVWTLHEYGIVCPHQRLYSYRRKAICEKCRVTAYHNAILERCIKDSYAASILGCAQSLIYRWLATYEKLVDRFIAPSEFLRGKMVEFGISPEKITTLPYLLNIDDYTWRRSAKDYFIYFGRLSQEKGLHTLLTAMKKVAGARLLIVGEGDLERTLKARVKREALTNIDFLGYRSGEELRELVRGALFMVIPSEWYDNSPLAIYETMAMGKPVLASRIGGIPELIDDGVDGFLFEPKNVDDLVQKIRWLIDDRPETSRMGERARTKVEAKYNEEDHYKMLSRIYKEVLASRGYTA